MTCVVGVPDGRYGVVVGADSAGVSGLDLTVRADSKVFARPDPSVTLRERRYVMGFTSSFRMGQLLRYDMELPKAPTIHTDLSRHMVSRFIPKVRDCLREGGWLESSDSRESGGIFLVGIQGRIFTIYSDFQVGESACGYAAIGCGSAYALGAVHAVPESRSATDRVLAGLRAASTFSGGVCPPYVLMNSDGRRREFPE